MARAGVSEEAVRRFEREAQVIARLRSPHTVELFDFGIAADGAFYYVMELLDGLDADSLLRRFGPIPPERAIYLLRQVCHSLSEAQSCGLVHRDIKPANIFLCRYGEEYDFVKVLDFGIVRRGPRPRGHEPGRTRRRTRSRARRRSSRPSRRWEPQVDGRADIYATGCLAYWLLTGQFVFTAETPMGLLLQHAQHAADASVGPDRPADSPGTRRPGARPVWPRTPRSDRSPPESCRFGWPRWKARAPGPRTGRGSGGRRTGRCRDWPRMTPIRVAFVSHHPHLRMGGQRSMVLLIEHLDRAVVEPMAICPGPGELSDHLVALGCPVVHIPLYHIKPRTARAVWRSSRRIRALLRERAIDIIAPDAPRDAVTCGIAKLGTPTRMIWFVRLTARHNLDPILERLSDGMIGVSEATRGRFSAGQRVTARYRTIFDGADMERFRPANDRAALRRALDLPADRFVLVFVGQVKEAKGVLDVVDAMGALAAAHAPARRPLLLIIGTPDPPAIVEEIARRARALDVAENVRVLPQQSDIERWLQAADVLVSGSHEHTEGLSRVLFEAMACGAVPVATDIQGNREALSAETGVLVAERSPEAMARAVSELMAAPPERLAALRAAGMRRAREMFDIRRHARQVEAFYLETIGGLRSEEA